MLSLIALLPALWLPSANASPHVQRFAPDTGDQRSAQDYLVRDLPGAKENELLQMYAGHIEVTPEHHGNLFFWLYETRKPAKKDSFVIWFNGGPGCSSMDGALMEIGPYRVNEDGSLRIQEGGWDEFASVLFIDNPVGTGFSYVDGDALVHDLAEMADQIIIFLEKWFAIFPKYAEQDVRFSLDNTI
jgi:carboxypeptidase D